jgi:hypothetical protein
MENALPQTENLSPITNIDEHYDQSFEEDTGNGSLNQTVVNNRSSAVKRPMNAFLLWARGERKRVSSDGSGVSQTSLSKFLGETWR